MRLLSALNYKDIEDFLTCLPGITSIDVVKDKKSLLDALSSSQYDLLIVSRELPGSEEMEEVIGILSGEKFKTQRVIFIYGEYDGACDRFIKLLLSQGIYDFFVGDEITSTDIERLVFKPCSKQTAFGYFQSRFDNEGYFSASLQKERKRVPGLVLDTLLKGGRRRKPTFEKLIISFISNQATGKSFTAWNLSYCISKRGNITSLVNLDRGYSANLLYDIDEIFYDLLDFTIHNNMHRDILDNCCKKKNLNIITGRLGDDAEIGEDDFIRLLYNIRTKSDITIIDTRTGLSALTRLTVKNSTYDLLIFDCDLMHYHMNMKFVEELGDDFIPEKTIAVINNTNVKSSSHKFIYNELKNSGIPFKDIALISSCGFLGCEVMHTGIVPYQAAGEEYKEFARDMDMLLDKLSTGQCNKGVSSRIFRR